MRLTLLLLFLALPTSAQAATVAVEQDALRITAAPGETNLLTVAPGAPGTLAVADGGAPLHAGAGCAAENELVVCSGATRVEASLGDGDDELVLSAVVPADVAGEAGGDRLLVAPIVAPLDPAAYPALTLDGGHGDDELTS